MPHFTLAEFWPRQAFAYLETYSFNRGPRSAELAASLRQELAATRQQLQRACYMDLAKLGHRVRQLEAALQGGELNVTLPLAPAPPDYGTQLIARLSADAGLTRQLREIAARATAQEAYAMCLPTYRDALVFCDAQGRRVRVLNICFECLRMATNEGQLVEADLTTYEALQRTLLSLGHPIEPGGWR